MRLVSFLIALMVLCVSPVVYSQEAHPDIFVEGENTIYNHSNSLGYIPKGVEVGGIVIGKGKAGKIVKLQKLPELTYTVLEVNAEYLNSIDVGVKFLPNQRISEEIKLTLNVGDSFVIKNPSSEITPGFQLFSKRELSNSGGTIISTFIGYLNDAFLDGDSHGFDGDGIEMGMVLLPDKIKRRILVVLNMGTAVKTQVVAVGISAGPWQ